jgi:hypothetical protein
MKPFRFALIALSLFAATSALAQTAAQKSFDQLKTLGGSWEGKDGAGTAIAVSFRDIAGGSALMSEIHGHGPEQMISMLHMDGPNRLILTHYCGAGNQPRMSATTSARMAKPLHSIISTPPTWLPRTPATCSEWPSR